MFTDATNRPLSAARGTPKRAAPSLPHGTPDRFGGKGSGSIYDVGRLHTPPATAYAHQVPMAERATDSVRSGPAFGATARFDSHGSVYAEIGSAVDTPGVGSYTPIGTRKSARKKSAVRLQAAFRGAIARRQSRGLFAEQLRVSRIQPGPGEYESHLAHTIAHAVEPVSGETASTSAFRDGIARFEDHASIYATHQRPSTAGGHELSGRAWARTADRFGVRADSADKLVAAAHALLRAQQTQQHARTAIAAASTSPSRPASSPALVLPQPVAPAIFSARTRAPPKPSAPPSAAASVLSALSSSCARDRNDADSVAAEPRRAAAAAGRVQPAAAARPAAQPAAQLISIDEAREQRAAVHSPAALALGAKLLSLKLTAGAGAGAGEGAGAGACEGLSKVRFSVGIAVGSYEPLALGGSHPVSPVVSEGGTTNGAYDAFSGVLDAPQPSKCPPTPRSDQRAPRAECQQPAAAAPEPQPPTPRYSRGGTAVGGYDSFRPAAQPVPRCTPPLDVELLSVGQLFAQLQRFSAQQVDQEDYCDDGVWDVDGLKSDLELVLGAATLEHGR